MLVHTDVGSYVNNAKVTVSINEGINAVVQRPQTFSLFPYTTLFRSTKSVDPGTLAEPGGDFTFTLKIHNTSVEPVTIDALTDDNTLSQDCLDLVEDRKSVV